jgi:DNA adenine methylase
MNTSAVEEIKEKYVKPFVKWAGGKRQTIQEIKKRMPEKYNRYLEPFLGGGAVFFSLNFKSAVIGDINEELINTYNIIKNNIKDLIDSLKKHYYDKEYYYEIRALNPQKLDEIERAGRFIFLNRTCFNGLYRVNKKGLFNVPFGRYKSPLICDEKNLKLVSKKLKSVEIKCGDYKEIVSCAQKNDFIYFDPPYMPLTETSNFVNYNKNGFSKTDQIELRDLFAALSNKGVFCLLSNSYTEEIINLYSEFNIDTIKAYRNINSRVEGRGKIKEVVIKNY